MEYTNKIKNAVDAMESANNRNELLKQYSLARESLDNLLTELRNKLRADAPIPIAACKPIDLDDLEMRCQSPRPTANALEVGACKSSD